MSIFNWLLRRHAPRDEVSPVTLLAHANRIKAHEAAQVIAHSKILTYKQLQVAEEAIKLAEAGAATVAAELRKQDKVTEAEEAKQSGQEKKE